mgnify:CR=1 FL=1
MAILAWIVATFFQMRGGVDAIPRQSVSTFSAYLFPLVGLVAFFLVWTQVMIGSLRPWWQRLFPGIVRWHRKIGIFVLLFALLHPLLLIIGIGLASFFHRTLIPPVLIPWIWVGEVQLFLILVTTLTALMNRATWLRRRWRLFHLLNYIVFCLVWLHSWFLGIDVTRTSLRWLWYFFAGTFLIAVTSRIIHSLRSSKEGSLPNKRRNTL